MEQHNYEDLQKSSQSTVEFIECVL